MKTDVPQIRMEGSGIFFEEKRKVRTRLMGKYFGTDGFRGRAGIDLTAAHAFKTANFSVRVM